VKRSEQPSSEAAAEERLAAFVGEYDTRVRTVAAAALKEVRRRLPGAVELVYDNYNALAIAFSPSEKRGDIVLSVTLYPRWVSLFFTRGVELRDPRKLLKGGGKAIRHVVLEDAGAVKRPEVNALIDEALRLAPAPFEGSARRVVIKMALARKRPRRPQ
jgi:hypothetical protein